MITVLSVITGAYIFGSIPWGYVLCRAVKKIDIRKHGSGNIGATNVYRTAGPVLGISVLILDILKGLLPVLLAKVFFFTDPVYLMATGIASILGHNFSLFLRGRGGKGVSTSFGVIIGLFPLPALIALLIWTAVTATTRYVSAGSIIASLSMPFFIYAFHRNPVFTAAGIIVSIMIVYTHRSNIKRLLEKKENRIRLPWERKQAS